jgi:ABC-type multidrug transport system fused ATPase/permease subunit
VLKQVFGMIRLVEERQWEIIGLDEFKDSLESAEVLKVYNRFSNRKYLQKERKNNVFLASTIPYFVFFVPWTLVLVLLCNRLFYALFDCRVSKYLRPYSLWWVLLELLLQNNVEYFTFLGCRSLDIPFSFSFQSRCLVLLSALMLLLTCFTAFSSYIIYYSFYQKLASYFLVNMYRLQSSFTLMTIAYGLKPMVKGLVHALLYDHFSLQLHLLLLAEFAGLLTTLLFEHAYGNHKSKSLLALEVVYSCSFVFLNAMILFKMVYFPDFPTITTEVEFLTTITVYVMAGTLALRILADIIL